MKSFHALTLLCAALYGALCRALYKALCRALCKASVGDLIDVLPVWRRFLLDIVGANEVDILIDYRAAFADQFDGISEIIAVVEVEINFVKKGDCFTSRTA